MPLTQVSPGLLDSNAQYYGFKNRIINGAMVIDQRNNGASVTVNSTGGFFAVDRFLAIAQPSLGVFTLQRSTVAPSGFTNSLLATVTTAATPSSADQYNFMQRIEGFNVADIGFGTAAAQPVTLSFQVRSSLTGTFAGGISNSSGTRSYVFTYTISAANTFEYKTITIPGDTTGTWLTDNGIGFRVIFDLGAGATFQATAGAWGSTYAYATSGSVKTISTNGATFYITGVQLEKGSTATSFDYRPYSTELALCQRYFQALTASGRYYTSDGAWGLQYPFKVTMRANPTYVDIGGGNNSLPGTNQGVISGSTQEAGVQWSGSAGTYWAYARGATFSAEL